MLLITFGQLVQFVNALLYVSHQVIQRVEQEVGRMARFQFTPSALDIVQIGTVGRQPLDFQPVLMSQQKSVHLLVW